MTSFEMALDKGGNVNQEGIMWLLAEIVLCLSGKSSLSFLMGEFL